MNYHIFFFSFYFPIGGKEGFNPITNTIAKKCPIKPSPYLIAFPYQETPPSTNKIMLIGAFYNNC